ncbi:MAG: queuosine precursor transporter [Simkaniaceae bacterium]|nr:queuosine precursor transporter [Simkaniaceae bacterium]MCF7852688.1 queuosine precursor transporter [Simkaniaceae bacterium]
MMNELLFFGHLTVIVAFTFIALRLGKEALMILIAVFALLANVFIVKETSLFGLTVTCTDAFAVGSLLALNLLQQYYGEQSAKKTALRSLLALAAFPVLSLIHLFYQPSIHDTAHEAYSIIFSHSPRIISASLFSFFIVQRIDILFFAFLKKNFSKVPLFILMAISLSITQTLDTIMFSFLGLYGIIHSLSHIILMTLVIKGIAILFMSPLTSLSRFFIKRDPSYAT